MVLKECKQNACIYCISSSYVFFLYCTIFYDFLTFSNFFAISFSTMRVYIFSSIVCWVCCAVVVNWVKRSFSKEKKYSVKLFMTLTPYLLFSQYFCKPKSSSGLAMCLFKHYTTILGTSVFYWRFSTFFYSLSVCPSSPSYSCVYPVFLVKSWFPVWGNTCQKTVI